MGKYLSPFTDMTFKRFFGQEENKDILIGFLNRLLEGEHHITDLSFEDKENIPEGLGGKTIIFDILCTTDNGEKIIVEMQNDVNSDFIDRTVYYMSRSMAKQGKRGNAWGYEQIRAVYGIFLMNDNWDDADGRARVDVALCDTETGKVFSDKMRMVMITFPLFNKTKEECVYNWERWLYVLKNMEHMDEIPFKEILHELTHFEEVADISSMSPEELRKYERELDRVRDNRYILRSREEKGRKEGLEEGAILMIRSMAENGLDNETIAKISKRPIEEVTSILSQR